MSDPEDCMITEMKKQVFLTEMTLDDLTHSYERPMHEANRRQWHEAEIRDEQGLEWYAGLEHHNDGVKLLTDGWTKGADKISKLARDAIKDLPAAHSRKRKMRWQDDGDSLDIDRALVGQWDTAYRSAYRKWTAGPTTIELITSWGGNCHKSEAEMFWTGATGVVLADVLEEAGYGVRLIGASLVGSCYLGADEHWEGRLAYRRIIVKEAGDPMRVDAVAAALCHAGIYRTFGFHSILSTPWKVGSRLGQTKMWDDRSYGVRDKLKEADLIPEDHGGIVLEHAYTRDAAIAEIRNVVAQIQNNHEEEGRKSA